MKKTLLSLSVITLLLVAFKFESNKDMAKANQVEGLYIFTQSKPVAEYEYLGTVKSSGVVPSFKEGALIPHMIKRAKAEYPNAEGLIFIPGEDLCRVDAIKFK